MLSAFTRLIVYVHDDDESKKGALPTSFASCHLLVWLKQAVFRTHFTCASV